MCEAEQAKERKLSKDGVQAGVSVQPDTMRHSGGHSALSWFLFETRKQPFVHPCYSVTDVSPQSTLALIGPEG